MDHDTLFGARELSRQGYDVVKISGDMADDAIRVMVEAEKGILVTRNYKDYKGMSQVVRVSGSTRLTEQLRVTINSLEAAKVNPEVWLRMEQLIGSRQIPASGINLGLLKPPKTP